jgi:hypothetical protein
MLPLLLGSQERKYKLTILEEDEMKIKGLAGLVVLCVLGFSGCARVALYSDEQLKGPETGFRVYYPKPYLLVAQTGSKDNPVQASVVYLPDQKNVRYAKLKSGYGTAELSLAFQNGMLTNVGQKTDTKIPETISAIAGLATAAKGLMPQAANYREISIKLKSVSEGLSVQLRKAEEKSLLTKNELQVLDISIKKIQDASSLLYDPTKAADNLSTVISYLKNSIDNLKPMGAGATPVRETIQKYTSELQDILQQLSPPPPEKPAFELYEIDNSSGITVLKRVN